MMSLVCCTTRSKSPASFRIALFLLACLIALPMAGQGSLAAYQRLEAVTKATSLLYAGQPWHLRLDVQLYGKTGLLDQQGTFDRWQSEDDSRTVSSFGGTTRTVVEANGKLYREMQGEALPYAATALLEAVLHPGPYPSEMAGTDPDLRHTAFGKQEMDCIMLSKRLSGVKTTPLGVFPTYCLSSGDHLNVIYGFGNDVVVRTQVGKFQGLEVTVGLTLMEGDRVVARGKVTQLSTFTPKPDEFTPTTELAATSVLARMSGGVIAGNKLSGAQPIYPERARMDRISGSVVLSATIGTDGHIHTLVPISGPDPDLVISALLAVRTWTYKPYLLNGVPTDVQTTVTVNYNLR